MYVLVLLTCASYHIQHTPGYHDCIDGRHAERREFRRRTGDVHEYRRRG